MPPWDGVEKKRQTCAVCGKDFYKKRQAKYCSGRCCEKSRKRVYDPDYRRPYMKRRRKEKGDLLRAQEKDRRDAVMGFVRAYKVTHGCADCGYREHHAALHFDHVRGEKEINVCNAKSVGRAKAEIKKCEVVCAICHAIRTFKRLHPED